jgi:hypothetical protein
VLAPEIGEIIGGSQREERLEVLDPERGGVRHRSVSEGSRRPEHPELPSFGYPIATPRSAGANKTRRPSLLTSFSMPCVARRAREGDCVAHPVSGAVLAVLGNKTDPDPSRFKIC